MDFIKQTKNYTDVTFTQVIKMTASFSRTGGGSRMTPDGPHPFDYDRMNISDATSVKERDSIKHPLEEIS